MKGKRDSLTIVLEILRLLRTEGANITKVVYSTNLNHESAEKHLMALVRRNLIGVSHLADGRTTYSITEKGKELHRELEDALRILNES